MANRVAQQLKRSLAEAIQATSFGLEAIHSQQLATFAIHVSGKILVDSEVARSELLSALIDVIDETLPP